MAGGAPTKYKKEYCQKLIAHMQQGFSYDTFAAIIDVHLDTLYEWEKVHKEFSEAKKRGFLKSKYRWEEVGMSGMMGEILNFNSGTWIFNMKNRFKWTDRLETKEAPIGNLSRKELLAEAREILTNLEKEENND